MAYSPNKFGNKTLITRHGKSGTKRGREGNLGASVVTGLQGGIQGGITGYQLGGPPGAVAGSVLGFGAGMTKGDKMAPDETGIDPVGLIGSATQIAGIRKDIAAKKAKSLAEKLADEKIRKGLRGATS